MPPKPWPKTVFGFPLWLGPSFLDFTPDVKLPMPHGLLAYWGNRSFAFHINGKDMASWSPLFEAIRDHFGTIQIPITQVIYLGNTVMITLERRGVDTKALPHRAGGIPCTYVYSDETSKPRLTPCQTQDETTSPITGHSRNNTMMPKVTLKHLVKLDTLKKGDLIVLDSPDTGYIEGVFQAQAYQRLPAGDADSTDKGWVLTGWCYMGQDCGAQLHPGMRGNAVWTRGAKVAGFFRYVSDGTGTRGAMPDWCCITAADELINESMINEGAASAEEAGEQAGGEA
ncbi:BAG domain protein [Purpureocillium lavendulum]|uniref:BAG domain protein n=1 Tax=Purpureocillium lavendulum TaxID=1247861 RepID=A0AB34FIR3_9HYPO|nr:BAG domain protein [Purpureocillium lavendulum]